VSTGKNDVNYVVTEYGVARLRGRPSHERVAALIAIAHPAFREELRPRRGPAPGLRRPQPPPDLRLARGWAASYTLARCWKSSWV
jgi:acyl-CoA hydrolase